MNFDEAIAKYIKHIETIKEHITNEEATKTSLVMPFFHQVLGYNIFNPAEFVPEFTADVGIKKGEKVDYAILENGKPLILIEVKSINEKLNKHKSQLFRYFGTTAARFGILTNGITYRVYTDLDEINKMDPNPFLEFNLLKLKEQQISAIKQFQRENFDINTVVNKASEFKIIESIKNVLKAQINSPNDAFVRFILNEDIYSGTKTQNVLDKYREFVKIAFNQFINDTASERLGSSMDAAFSFENDSVLDTPPAPTNQQLSDFEQSIFNQIKEILSTEIPENRVNCKKVSNYFSILIDNNIRKWVCRIRLKANKNELHLRKIDGLDYELEYIFGEASDIVLISDELRNTAKKI